MGTRGPAPKPAWQKKLEGNPGKRPIKEEIKLDPRTPSCPPWLSELAKAEWARLVPELERLRILRHLDRTAFAAYCQSYAEWVECEAVLSERGKHYVTPSGKLHERPEVAMAQQAQKRMLTFARELGMTPVSRARLSPQPYFDDDEEEDDPLLDWMQRRR